MTDQVSGAGGVDISAGERDPAAVALLLRALPTWFGMEAANAHYVEVADGVEVLQVKTLGPSRPHEAYAATRAFYEAVGFRPLEELPDLWPGNPCLLMVKTLST